MANMASAMRTLKSFMTRKQDVMYTLEEALSKYIDKQPNKEVVIENGEFFELGYKEECKLLKITLSSAKENHPITVTFIKDFKSPNAKEVTEVVWNFNVLVAIFLEVSK